MSSSTAVSAATNPFRGEVLMWYRRLLKSAFEVHWATDDDAYYVLTETRRLFRRNMEVSDTAAIERKVREAESRYELGVHYRIPYPRMYHKPIGSLQSSGVAYANYLDSAYDGDEANPKMGVMQDGTVNAAVPQGFGGAQVGVDPEDQYLHACDVEANDRYYRNY